METVTYTNRFGESVTFGGPPFYLQEITGLGDQMYAYLPVKLSTLSKVDPEAAIKILQE